jgi:hypothetical protein
MGSRTRTLSCPPPAVNEAVIVEVRRKRSHSQRRLRWGTPDLATPVQAVARSGVGVGPNERIAHELRHATKRLLAILRTDPLRSRTTSRASSSSCDLPRMPPFDIRTQPEAGTAGAKVKYWAWHVRIAS